VRQDAWIEVIEDVADELGLEIRRDAEGFEVATDRWNTVAFRIVPSGAGHLVVSPWLELCEGSGSFADPCYSLRSTLDVVRFCQVLAIAIPIRAGRRPGEA